MFSSLGSARLCARCAGSYKEGAKPWKTVEECHVAMPCATQNEVDASDVEALVKVGCTVRTHARCTAGALLVSVKRIAAPETFLSLPRCVLAIDPA